MQRDVWLARLAVAVLILYLGTMLLAAATWPEDSPVIRYMSELGGPEAPRPALFNGGIVLMGCVCLLAAVGLFRAARRFGGRAAFSAAAATFTALFVAAMVMGGLFPLPDPRHGAFGLGLVMILAPLFLALALRGRPGFGGLVGFLFASFALIRSAGVPLATSSMRTARGVPCARAFCGTSSTPRATTPKRGRRTSRFFTSTAAIQCAVWAGSAKSIPWA